MKPDTTALHAIMATLGDFAAFPILQAELGKLDFVGQVAVLAIGKSAHPMALAALRVLQQKDVPYSGYLLTKHGFAASPLKNITSLEAGHPVPDASSLSCSGEIVAWLQGLATETDLIVLLSGGGSALFELPEQGLGLKDIIALNHKLLHSGQSIAEINAARAKLSRLKSGKALNFISCGRMFCYALSDVQANDPAVIASGPFYHSKSIKLCEDTYQYLNSDKKQLLHYRIIGDNLSFRKLLARHLPAPVWIWQGFLAGSAQESSALLANFAQNEAKKGTYLWGGESPVTVSGNGKGGRCTHLALDFALRIAGHPSISLIAYATDANDNISACAGAIVDGNTCANLHSKGINPQQALINCDSFTALKAVDATITSPALAINVNDIYILLIN